MYYTTIVTRQDPQWNAEDARITNDDYRFSKEETETTVTYDAYDDITRIYTNNATDITRLTNIPSFTVEEIRIWDTGTIGAVKGTLQGHRLTIRS